MYLGVDGLVYTGVNLSAFHILVLRAKVLQVIPICTKMQKIFIVNDMIFMCISHLFYRAGYL